MQAVDLPDDKMTPQELRATASLASIYGLRMFGMFSILPIFAVYAANLPEKPSSLMVGIALGAYGLTQALFQLPFGIASDKYGRKPLIYFGLLLFAIGSLIAAFSTTIESIILGRIIQGAGAISAVVTALVADLTRDEHRTKAMATIGATIGVAFAISLVGGPILHRWIGVPGIFALTAVLTVLAMLVVKFLVPNPQHSHFHSDAGTAPEKLSSVLKDKQLLRLNFGIFALHATQMAMFVVVPFAITEASQLDIDHHWTIYLPVLIASFILMIPAIIYAEKKSKLKQVFVAAIFLMLIAQSIFALSIHQFIGIIVSLCVYFIAFNILEASLPSIISKISPASAKGTAIGVYNTSQSFGVFVGGSVGGFLSHHHGFTSVFIFCGLLMFVWLILASSMQTPPAVRTKMYTFNAEQRNISSEEADALKSKLVALAGVVEAAVLPNEGTIILKIEKNDNWDDTQVYSLL